MKTNCKDNKNTGFNIPCGIICVLNELLFECGQFFTITYTFCIHLNMCMSTELKYYKRYDII